MWVQFWSEFGEVMLLVDTSWQILRELFTYHKKHPEPVRSHPTCGCLTENSQHLSYCTVRPVQPTKSTLVDKKVDKGQRFSGGLLVCVDRWSVQIENCSHHSIVCIIVRIVCVEAVPLPAKGEDIVWDIRTSALWGGDGDAEDLDPTISCNKVLSADNWNC